MNHYLNHYRNQGQANTLFWRLVFFFFGMLVVLGFIHVWIITNISENYFLKRQQQLNAPIAKAMIKEVDPYVQGEIRSGALHQVMHAMMAVNPAVEVYFLDTSGYIMEYVVPYHTVQLEQVDLEPIHTFLETQGEELIKGQDPKKPNEPTIFSAAPVFDKDSTQLEDSTLVGYVYIILQSVEYSEIKQNLRDEYWMELGGNNILLTLAAALLIGIAIFWLLTRNLRTIIHTVKRFKEGDQSARIPESQQGELRELVTTFNEMAEEVAGNFRRKEKLEKLRKELLANVSHDLRTPLTIINGYAETILLKNGHLSKKDVDQYLEKLLEAVGKMDRLISELFELSKLDADQIQPYIEPFAVDELIQDIVHSYEIVSEDKEITIFFEQPSRANVIVAADIQLIDKVIHNLIDNAFKYSDVGGVISIRIQALVGHVEIQVADNGIGIPEEDLPYIFDRYYKSSHQQHMDRQGTGLGLAIVKKILQLHHSHISVSSTPGEGTVFTFSLPLFHH